MGMGVCWSVGSCTVCLALGPEFIRGSAPLAYNFDPNLDPGAEPDTDPNPSPDPDMTLAPTVTLTLALTLTQTPALNIT